MLNLVSLNAVDDVLFVLQFYNEVRASKR